MNPPSHGNRWGGLRQDQKAGQVIAAQPLYTRAAHPNLRHQLRLWAVVGQENFCLHHAAPATQNGRRNGKPPSVVVADQWDALTSTLHPWPAPLAATAKHRGGVAPFVRWPGAKQLVRTSRSPYGELWLCQRRTAHKAAQVKRSQRPTTRTPAERPKLLPCSIAPEPPGTRTLRRHVPSLREEALARLLLGSWLSDT